ncbi:ATP-binding protein [Streptosporangium sp. NPDC020145]|uniref:ATP-binding protein n=1 Tax=Streptosporangium sp. NPDC020145 TaxID=3154694 RepID=UPI003412ACD3
MEEILETSVAPSERLHSMDLALSVLGERWIPHEARYVASARRFVREIAVDWKAAEGIPEIAELLTSEIVTNAVVHAAARPVQVSVMREGRLMVVEACDFSSAVPQIRSAASMEASGRGLTVVKELSHAWGWLPNPHGKSVWFELVAWP